MAGEPSVARSSRDCRMWRLRKALATFGSGPAARLLALAFPSFSDYAERHGYDIVVGDGNGHGRPAAWGKVPLLQRLLEHYDFVLWIDADAVILDASVDLETIVPAEAFQALAIITCAPGKGTQPAVGVWALRAGVRTQEFLAEVWRQDDLVSHRLMEMAAVMRLLGWTTELPFVKERPSDWDEGTFVLDEEWDMVPQLPIGYAAGKIRHYAGWANYRRREFDMRTDLARLRGAHIRYRIGLLERRYRPLYWPITGHLRHRATQVLALSRRARR
jgi:hypothetical protein